MKPGTNRQVKVYAVDQQHILSVLRGEMRIRNLPSDAQVVTALPVGNRIGIRFHSAQFPSVPSYEPLPLVTAVFERIRPEKEAA